MILRNLVKTCESSPAQWTAINERGEPVYIRYRFDTLTVHCPFDPQTDEGKGWDYFVGTQILNHEQVFGDALRGWLDESELLALTGYSVLEENQP